MAQSHDLVQFMRQEDRVHQAKIAQADIDMQKSVINHHEKKDDPKVEEKLMQTDKDCLKAEKPLSQQDLFTSSALTVESFGIDAKSILGIPRKIYSGDLPFCSEYYDLEFSMAAFEHLPSVRWRRNLTVGAERVLSPGIHRGWPNVSDYGFAVTDSLKKDGNVWWLHNMAILYWRVIGNGTAAIECVRRALHLAPREYLALPMLNLASILHQASRSRDAAQVMDIVLSLNDSLPSAHCVAGDVYAVAIQYNKSLISFNQCVKMDPGYPGAHIRRAAVKCHQKLERTLESQHENLQKTLTELQSYQSRLRNYQNLHEQTYKNVADPETKKQMSLSYDYFTYGPFKHMNCVWKKDNRVRYINCVVEDEAKFLSAKRKRQETLDYSRTFNRTATSQIKVPVTPGTMSQPAAVDFDKEKAFLDALEPLRNLALPNPTFQRIFPKMNKNEWTSADYVFLNELWPDEDDCKSNTHPLPSMRDFPHVFLSPRNKGFEVDKLLTKYLNLGEGEEHPLPWYPPFCSVLVSHPTKLDLPCCDHLLGVQRAKKKDREQLVSEPQLKDTFLSLTHTNVETEAEMGQRIHTLLKYNIGPKWVLLNLAALYWRVVGVSAEASGCLRLALSDPSAKQYADVSLLQLSQLATRAGDRLDDGIVLIKQAVQTDSREPASQFLLGYFLALKRSFTGAEQHFINALNLDPKHPGAIEALKSIRCHQKYTGVVPAEPPTPKSLPPSKCDKNATPRFFCMKSLNGEERCFLEEMTDSSVSGLSVPTSSSCSRLSGRGTSKCQVPLCVPPPPLAPLLLPFLDKDLGKSCSICNVKKDELGSCSKNGTCREKTEKVADSRSKRDGSRAKIPSIAVSADEEQEEVTLDSDNVVKATGRQLNDTPPVVKPPPSKQTVRYGLKSTDHAEQNESKKVADVSVPDGSGVVQEGQKIKKDTEVEPEKSPQKVKSASENVEDAGLIDCPLPEVLTTPYPYQIRGGARLVPSLPSSSAECAALKKHVKLDQATSTWLSVTAKGVRLDQFIDFSGPTPKEFQQPVCPDVTPATMWTMDHLHGFRLRDSLTQYKPEKGLKDAFQNLGNKKDTLQGMATRLARAIKNSKKNPSIHMSYEGGVHWSLTTVAALYWRVRGNLSMSVQCLRHSLNNAPYHMRDLALVSLANVYHQAGMLHSALVAAGAALQLSPRFVVIHFTLANIYSAMGDLDHAIMFYYSTLALQNNFDPARERIRAIYCITGRIPAEAENVED